MTWKSSKGAASPKSGGANFSRYGPESALQRLVRFVAEEGGVHAFIHRATADQGVVEEARALTRMLLGGQDIPAECRQLCRRFGVGESLLRARLWAVASLFSDQHSDTAGPYEILGLEPCSGQDAIKRAFRALCRKWHPDHNLGDTEAATRFRRIKAAYDMLSDSAGAQGWGVNAWEEPGPRFEKKTWERLRRLAPLGVVVGFLVLVVAFADHVVHFPRYGSVPRETSRNVTILSDTNSAAEDGVQQNAREPLVLEGATSGQSAVAKVVQPEVVETGGGGNVGAEHANACCDPPSGFDGGAVRRKVGAPGAERGDGPSRDVAIPRGKAAGASPPKKHEDTVGLRDVEERVATFIAAYVRDYSRRDLESFMRHFTPSALENGTPLTSLLRRYEENFRKIPTMRYSIMVDAMNVGPDLVRFAGRCELRGLHADGRPIALVGMLHMDLEPFGATFRVRSLQYVFR